MSSFEKCQCPNAGWCDLYKKEMTENPPNWQWCQSATPAAREKHYISGKSRVRTFRQSVKNSSVDLIQFYDKLPEKTSDYAVCVIPANEEAMSILDLTRGNIKKYAEKCNADYIELSGDQHPNWPMANKYRLHQVTSVYKKTLYLDCDIVVKENSPNIFNETPDDKISAYDEWEIWEAKNDTHWINAEQDLILKRVLEPEDKQRFLNNGAFVPPKKMINGGVLVIPQELADYYQQPEQIYPKRWCFDQNLLTLLVPEDKFYNLPRWYNFEYVAKDFFDKYNDAHFIHVNNLRNKESLRLNTIDSLIRGEELYNLPLYESMLRLGWVKAHPQIERVKPEIISDPLPEPKNSRAICVINTSDYTEKQLSFTRDRIVAYADKCNADYIELKDDKFPAYPMFNKYRLYNVTRLYDKTLYLDCDIVINDHAPDIFKETPDNKISIHCEKDYLDETCRYYIIDQMTRIRQELDVEEDSEVEYLNGGVMVIPRSLSNLYQMPDFDIPTTWCFDQIYLGLELDKSQFNNLSNKWNCSFKHSTFPDFGEYANFMHFNNPTSTRCAALSWYTSKEYKGFYTEFGCIPTTECAHHRSGWNYICKKLFDNHSDTGIYLDATLENSFSWKEKWYKQIYHVPYVMPWVGFLHNPPNSPDFFYKNKDMFYGSVDQIFETDTFKRSLEHCRGIFTLSSHLSNYIEEKIGVPTLTFKLPIVGEFPKWDAQRAFKNKELAMIGYWHRKFKHFLNLDTNMRKSFLGGLKEPLESWIGLECREFELSYEPTDFTIYNPMVNFKYDDKLTEVVVFLDFWDTAANTSLMDCIARNTPVIICKHPAVVEYLGEDYPLYFTDQDSANALANDFDKIESAHRYLKNMDKGKFTEEYFFERLGAWNDLIKK